MAERDEGRTTEQEQAGMFDRVRAWARRHPVICGGAVTVVVGGVAYAVAPKSMRQSALNGVKGLFTSDTARHVAEAAVKVEETAAPVAERSVGGISESRLNEIAQGVYHGVGAWIDDLGHIVFKWKSNSGKTTSIARLSVVDGGIGIDQGLVNVSNASTLPGIFADRVLEEMAAQRQ